MSEKSENDSVSYVEPDISTNLFYYIKLNGQKNRNTNEHSFFNFIIKYSTNRNELNNYRNKEFYQLSTEKKINKKDLPFTESVEFIDYNVGITTPMIESVVLSIIYEDSLNFDIKDGDTSVKTTEKIEVPYDCSPKVALDTINNYLKKYKTKDLMKDNNNE